jgi:hypothetical protein
MSLLEYTSYPNYNRKEGARGRIKFKNRSRTKITARSHQSLRWGALWLVNSSSQQAES